MLSKINLPQTLDRYLAFCERRLGGVFYAVGGAESIREANAIMRRLFDYQPAAKPVSRAKPDRPL